MATVPGSAGLPLIGDKSYDFYKDPVKFVNKNIEQHKYNDSCLDLGYKQFMGEIYGDNILFTDGDAAFQLRASLTQLFTADALMTYQDTVEKIVDKVLTTSDFKEPCCIYELMKKICTEICLTLFLGIDFDKAVDIAQTIVSLTTTHWHGIISVPIAIKLPMMDASTYSKALNAKEELLKIIQHKKQDSPDKFPNKIQQIPHRTEDIFSNNHLLLFTSALVPKALSSLLTSFMIEVAQDQGDLQERIQVDSDLANSYLLEIQRLYPPFLGGRRVVRQDMVVNGYKIPKGHAIVYMTYAAHRDPDAFTDPDQFLPERWQKSTSNKDKLLCFGSGPRSCIGQTLVWNIIQSPAGETPPKLLKGFYSNFIEMTVIRKLLLKFHVQLLEGQDLSHKMLPVSRPKNNVLAKFMPREQV